MRKWWDAFTDTWMVNTGLVSSDFMDELRKKWPHYTPLTRDIQAAGKNGLKGGNNQFKLKAITKNGSNLPYINPIVSFQAHVNRIVKAARQNETAGVLYRYLRSNETLYGKHNTDIGLFARFVDPDTEAKTVSTSDLIKKLEGVQARYAKNVASRDALDVFDLIINNFLRKTDPFTGEVS